MIVFVARKDGTVETPRIRKALTDIQYGRAEDTYRWMQRVV